MNRFIVDFEDIKISGAKDDTSNSLDRNSVAGGIDNDFNNEQTTEVVNGGPGSGNFGHSGQQKLKERATKAKTLEEFHEVLKEMEASPHDFSVWKKNVGDPARASLERKLELKSKVKNPEQQKAVDDLKATGIDLPKASEKWLRENCPQELVESITSSMKQAEKDGLALREARSKMTETTTRGGRCTENWTVGPATN